MSSDFLNFSSGLTFIASGVLFILGPLLTGPIAGALPATSLGFSAPALAASGAASLVGNDAPGLGAVALPAGAGRTSVLAGLGRAASVGGLAVPPTWAGAAPAVTRVATALPEPALVDLAEAGADGMGPGYGGMLPGSLMAAAAGGGGAAGGGWAATRGAAATQRGGAQSGGGPAQPGGGAQPAAGTRTRYGPPPAVIPQVAREASLHEGIGQAMRPDGRAQGGEGPSTASLRDEINDLRKQLAELAMEREVLMRSLALWAKGSTGQ